MQHVGCMYCSIFAEEGDGKNSIPVLQSGKMPEFVPRLKVTFIEKNNFRRNNYNKRLQLMRIFTIQ